LQDAVKIATVAFERGQDANAQLTQSNWQQANVEWGNTRSFVQDVSITAKRTD